MNVNTALGQDRPAIVIGRSLRQTLFAGTAVIVTFFGGFGTWAAWAPLSGAAVAPAVISPEGKRRTVQHLEGGIVRDLLVRDGSIVEPGQPLLVLESSIARASYDFLLKDLRTNLATQWRLRAERENAPDLVFSIDLAGDDDSKEVRELFEAQRALFFSRRDARAKRKEILEQRIVQLDEEITGLKAQILSQTTQLALIREEARGVSALVDKGYERRARLLALQRTEAEIVGGRASNRAAIARALSAIAEARAQTESIVTQHMEEVETQLAQGAANLAGIREKLLAAADVVDRTVIAAPVAGTVVELRTRTIGGVVTAGQPILDIVPSGEELLFDARISPNDIDQVRPGQRARVMVTGFNQRNTPPLDGTVREVSADRIVDPGNGQIYYLARIELSADRVREVAPDVALKSGMSADVMVMTGERSLLDYLLEPLLASFRKTFRES